MDSHEGSDTVAESSAFTVLKGRIKQHYDLCSTYYQSLWGEHIHHGYFLDPSETKEQAQINLIELLLEKSGLEPGETVLDVGCGIGGTSRYLARERACHVVGITISNEQVRMARKISGGDERSEGQISQPLVSAHEQTLAEGWGPGSVYFVELDAEKMFQYFSAKKNIPGRENAVRNSQFDTVWISEALSHFPNKQLFFHNAFKILLNGPGGKLVIADWFRAEDLSEQQLQTDIKPIEDGMLVPPLCTISDYVSLAKHAGFRVRSPPQDISQEVAKTWDISFGLISDPALWKLALAAGRDAVGFLRAFQAMRRGYKSGAFRYAVMVFQK